MAFQTNVFRDGEWVTETVALDTLLKGKGNSKTTKSPALEPRYEKPPKYGILTRTIIESPVAHWMLPVRLRSAQHMDVAIIGDHYVQISEMGHDNRLRNVVRKTDFGSRIRNAKVIGTSPESAADDEKDGDDARIHVKTEDDDAMKDSDDSDDIMSGVCKDALNLPVEFDDFAMEVHESSVFHYGRGEPLWSAWTRPYRLPTYNTTRDSIYLAREDGVVMFLDINSDNILGASVEIGKFDCNIGTAFCSVFDEFNDILIMGGDSGPGTIWQIRPRQPNIQIGKIPNWSPVVDFVTTDEFTTVNGLQGAKERKIDGGSHRSGGASIEQFLPPDRVFGTSGRGVTGAITEFRRGLRVDVGLEADYPVPVKKSWFFATRTDTFDIEYQVLISLVDRSEVLYASSDLDEFSSHADIFGDLAAVSTLVGSTFEGHLLQLKPDRSVSILETFKLPGDATCLCLSSFLGSPYIAIGLIVNESPSVLLRHFKEAAGSEEHSTVLGLGPPQQRPKVQFWTRYKKSFPDPVYCAVTQGENVFFCVGSTLYWDKLDLQEKRLATHGTFELSSRATSLRIVNNKVVTVTDEDSIEIIDFANGAPGNMVLYHSDSEQRSASHMIEIGSKVSGNELDTSVLLVCDRDATASGLWVPWRQPGTDCSVIFEADLPASVRKLVRGRTRPSWQQTRRDVRYGSVPSTPDDADILGVCLDGSLQHFMLLNLPAWRLLRLVHDLALTSPTLFPFTFERSDGDDFEADPDSGDRTVMQIDGDMLQRCVDKRALEGLFASNPVHAAKLSAALEKLDCGIVLDKEAPEDMAVDGEEGAPVQRGAALDERTRRCIDWLYVILDYYLQPVL
ncbi:hypothetical protein SCUCBS95973_008273 [Sporothrix curviconia]|uniref:RSE1/DDB1/CPSF1 first beta-propeller domain-containing protein n=1 Tax=Sporothrix curviconia TaxID=1260050 RepID=A0ABP0CKA2_9PEZI